MITIIHGDDLAASRNFYLEEKNKADNPIEFRGDKLEVSQLKQSVEGGSLFAQEKEIFIENLLSGRKKSKQIDEIIDYLNQQSKLLKVFIWEGNELTKSQTGCFKTAEIKLFKLPQNLFQFLDGIRPGNIQNLSLLHKALKGSSEEIIFYMMIRQFRLMLALSDGGSSEKIDEVKRLVPWQKGKLEKQANLFGQQKLLEAYQRLYEIDYKTKSGRTSLNLLQAIDFFLAEI